MGRSGTSESQISSIEALSTQSSSRWPSKELYHTVLLQASGAGFKSRGEIDSIEPSRRLAQGPAKFYFSCNRFNSCWCLRSSIRSIFSRVTVLSARIESTSLVTRIAWIKHFIWVTKKMISFMYLSESFIAPSMIISDLFDTFCRL